MDTSTDTSINQPAVRRLPARVRPACVFGIAFSLCIGLVSLFLVAAVSVAQGASAPKPGINPPGVGDQAAAPAEISIVKRTTGAQPFPVDGPIIAAGEPVTWTYLITNTGVTTLTHIVVSDSDAHVHPARVQGSYDLSTTLSPGEQWTFQATGPATIGPYVNTGTVTASSIDGTPITATAVSVYFGLVSGVALDKAAVPTTTHPGLPISYTYALSNTGNGPLVALQIADDRCAPLVRTGGEADGNERLEPGEVWRYQCVLTATQAITNTAVVTARDLLSRTMTATDTVFVNVVAPYYLPLVRTPPRACPAPDGCSIPDPKAFAVSEKFNLLFATARNPDRLLVIDPASAQVITTAATGSQPWGVAVNDANNRLYVSNAGSGDVWIYDLLTLKVQAKIAVGENPGLIAVLPGLDTAFVVVRTNSRLAVIKGIQKVQDIGSGGSGPFGIAADPVHQRIFVSNRDSRHLSAVQQENGAWAAHSYVVFEDGRNLFDLAYNPAINRLYVVYATPANAWFVGVWKPEQGALWGNEASIPVGSGGDLKSADVGGSGLAINLATGNVFNANTGAGTLSVIDSVTNRVKATVTVGAHPYPVAANGQTNTIFVGQRAPGALIKLEDTW